MKKQTQDRALDSRWASQTYSHDFSLYRCLGGYSTCLAVFLVVSVLVVSVDSCTSQPIDGHEVPFQSVVVQVQEHVQRKRVQGNPPIPFVAPFHCAQVYVRMAYNQLTVSWCVVSTSVPTFAKKANYRWTPVGEHWCSVKRSTLHSSPHT